jgi:hypothetical protein
MSPINYQITGIVKELSTVRLILRLPPEGYEGVPSIIQRDALIRIGSPEGNDIGSPGDLRIQIDEPAQLWIKETGVGTPTGWAVIGSGGGGGGVCNLLPQPIVSGSAGSPGVLATAARCDHEHPAPAIPSPSDANPQPDGVAAPGISALYARGDHVHPVASAGEQTVYEVDFRTLPTQAFADGPVVIGDRTWIAGGVASFALTWGLVNGQGLVGTVNNSAFNQWNDTAANAVRIQSTLGNLDPNYNPMARYGWEVELTANNASSFGAQCRAILGLFKPTAVEPGTEQCAAGLCSGNNNTPVYGVGLQNATTTAPMVTSYGFPATTVMRICNQPVAPGTVAAYVAPPSGGPGWPALSTYRGCGFVAQSATGLANLTTSVRWGEHPNHEIHIVMASASGLGFGLTFSRFRIIRFN